MTSFLEHQAIGPILSQQVNEDYSAFIYGLKLYDDLYQALQCLQDANLPADDAMISLDLISRLENIGRVKMSQVMSQLDFNKQMLASIGVSISLDVNLMASIAQMYHQVIASSVVIVLMLRRMRQR